MIDPRTIETIRERTDIVGLVSESVRIVKKGRTWKGCCPFHKEKTPSFHVNPERNAFHCLAGETGVLTIDGLRPIRELAGSTVVVLTRGGKWVPATFKSYGVQRLHKIELSRNGVKKTLYATAKHRWFTLWRKGAVTTDELPVRSPLESVLPLRRNKWRLDHEGIRHGIVFGDGSVQKHYGTVNLQGPKMELGKWFPDAKRSVRQKSDNKPYMRVYGGRAFKHMKDLPDSSRSKSYWLGFIAGYLATDGHVAEDGTVMLHCKDASVLQAVRDAALRLGIVTFGITTQMRCGVLDTPTPIHRIHFANSFMSGAMFLRSIARKRFRMAKKRCERFRWVVRSVEESDREEEVFCAEVPGEHAFAIEDNILTGNCFGCKESGDAIAFVQKTEGLTFVEAVTSLAGRLNIEIEETRTPQERKEAAAAKDQREAVYRANEIAALWFETNLWAGPVPAGIPNEFHIETRRAEPIGVTNAWAELDKRGLAPADGEHKLIGATLRAFRLGYAPPFWDHLAKHLVQMGISLIVAEQAGLVAPSQTGGRHYDRFRNRLMFAVIDVQGRVVGFSGRALPMPQGGDAAACKEPAKYVNTPESRVYTKGHQLFGLYQAKASIRRADHGVLVEGNFDVVSLHARGIDHVVAPLGTAFTQEQAALLKRFGTHVTLAFDPDAAGVKATAASREACTSAALSARVASLPVGKDPDVLVREQGPEGFRRLLDSASGLIEWLIDEALEPATFRRASLQEQLERVRAVGDLLAKENDPEMRGLAQVYANRAAARLGLTASSAITVQQLHNIITSKLRGGEKHDGKPVARVVHRGPGWALQEAILGALIDDPEGLDEHLSLHDVEQALDGDFALALASLVQHGARTEALAEMPASLRDFVAARFVEPAHDRQDITEIIRANVGKLLAMRKGSRQDDLINELDAAVASGNDNEVMRVMAQIDALGRR
jgi:DNA primase